MEDFSERPTKQLFIPQPPLPTVKIVSSDTAEGYVVINESDFDKETMKKFSEKKPASAPAAS